MDSKPTDSAQPAPQTPECNLLAQMAADRAEAFDAITQSELQCKYPTDGPDCGEIDDCLYHSLLRLTEPIQK